jgi:hypothetical protein
MALSSVQYRLQLLPFLLLFATGCSPLLSREGDSLLRSLEDRGPVAVSATNPYLAANLFLEREQERSAELKGFLETRGYPQQIEIRSGFFAPTLVHLIYHGGAETYEMVEAGSTWAISGPLEQSTVRDSEKTAAPVLPPRSSRAGKSEAFQSPAQTSAAQPLSDQAPSPRSPSAMAGESAGSIRPDGAAPTTRLSSTSSVPSPLDAAVERLIASHTGTPAEVTPKGDLVHFVTDAREHLTMIARWYTLDRSNADRIRRMNQLGNDRLEIGDMVIIPSYMVRNKLRLSASAIEQLR